MVMDKSFAIPITLIVMTTLDDPLSLRPFIPAQFTFGALSKCVSALIQTYVKLDLKPVIGYQ